MERKLTTILLCISLSIINIAANTANSDTATDTGVIYVVTEPPKAKILVNGRVIGITPGYYHRPVGSQEIQLEKRFYQTVIRKVTIKKGEITSLPPIILRKGKGKITVLPTQLDAKVYIDGALQSSVAPNTFQVPAGNHILRVVKGDLSWESNIELETDETIVRYAILKPPPTKEELEAARGEKGFVLVVTEPSGAEIYVDGEKQVNDEKKPILSPEVIEVTVGVHEVRVNNKFYQTSTKQVKVASKEVTRLEFKLKRGVGHITIISKPLGAKIYLDGKLQDYETPITLSNITARTYKLRLVKEDYYWRGKVDVNTDEITVQSVRLKRDDKPPTPGITTKAEPQAVLINGGSEITVSPKVTLTFKVKDETDITDVKVTNDEKSLDSAQWKPYSPEMEWMLDSANPGIKTVYVQFKDKANYSDTYSANITLLVPMDMVLIEEDAKFVMKIVTEDGNEKSETVSVKPYFIDKYEVTNAQYKEFVDATGYKTPDGWDPKKRAYPPGRDKYPVVNVSVEDAKRYAKWAGKRLPTEAEWVMAAIGTDNSRKWPWWKEGDRWDGKRASVVKSDGTNVKQVDSSPEGASLYGVYNMAGNVWEWVEQYQDKSTEKFTFGLSDKTEKSSFLRGGLLIINDTVVSDTSLRLYRDDKSGYPDVGFRCAMSLSDWK